MLLNRLYLHLAFSSSLMAVCSCQMAQEPPARPELVVEGWIDSNGFPTVLLSSSALPTEEPGKLEEIIARWGKVTIENRGKEVVMIGRSNTGIGFPFYCYYTYEMIGQPGEIYSIRAEYGGRSVVATCRMPSQIVEIDSLTMGSKGVGEVYFTAPEICPAYVVVKANIGGGTRFYPTPLGFAECLTPGASMSLPVYLPLSSVSKLPVGEALVGEELHVKLATVSKEVYDYWVAFGEIATVGSNSFVGTAENLPPTVSGGLGVWSAQGVSHTWSATITK